MAQVDDDITALFVVKSGPEEISSLVFNMVVRLNGEAYLHEKTTYTHYPISNYDNSRGNPDRKNTAEGVYARVWHPSLAQLDGAHRYFYLFSFDEDLTPEFVCGPFKGSPVPRNINVRGAHVDFPRADHHAAANMEAETARVRGQPPTPGHATVRFQAVLPPQPRAPVPRAGIVVPEHLPELWYVPRFPAPGGPAIIVPQRVQGVAAPPVLGARGSPAYPAVIHAATAPGAHAQVAPGQVFHLQAAVSQVVNSQVVNIQVANAQSATAQITNAHFTSTQVVDFQVANAQVANAPAAPGQVVNAHFVNIQMDYRQGVNAQVGNTQVANFQGPVQASAAAAAASQAAPAPIAPAPAARPNRSRRPLPLRNDTGVALPAGFAINSTDKFTQAMMSAWQPITPAPPPAWFVAVNRTSWSAPEILILVYEENFGPHKRMANTPEVYARRWWFVYRLREWGFVRGQETVDTMRSKLKRLGWFHDHALCTEADNLVGHHSSPHANIARRVPKNNIFTRLASDVRTRDFWQLA